MPDHRPADQHELAELVAWAAAEGEPLELVGRGSKRTLGRPLQTAHVLDMSAFSGIRAYEPEELVLTAGAATPLAEIEAALAAAGQMLAFEPGDWGRLLGAPEGAQSLGGVLSCNLSGPRRIKQGAARDHFLGFSAVSGRGEAFKAGGRVVKNVTGYDLAKLVAGAYGTLAALTEVTVKVLPRPEEERSLLLLGLDDERAIAAMARALGSPHEVSGAAHLPAALMPLGSRRPLTAIRVEGPAPSVAARSRALIDALKAMAPVEELSGEASSQLWRAIGDAAPMMEEPDRAVWRVSVPPSTGAAFVAAACRGLDCRHYFDWGGGLVWLAIRGGGDGGAAAIRAALHPSGGHATLIRAPQALRAAVPVFEPQPAPLAALTARVKDGFDPRRILNPGRMYRGL